MATPIIAKQIDFDDYEKRAMIEENAKKQEGDRMNNFFDKITEHSRVLLNCAQDIRDMKSPSELSSPAPMLNSSERAAGTVAVQPSINNNISAAEKLRIVMDRIGGDLKPYAYESQQDQCRRILTELGDEHLTEACNELSTFQQVNRLYAYVSNS